MVSGDATNGLITTAVDAVDLTDFSDDSAGGLIAAINDGNQMGGADITISDDVGDGLIATAINSTDCADTNVFDYSVGGLMMLMC